MLLALVFFARGYMEDEHPAAEVALQAGLPTPNTPLEVSGMEAAGPQRLDAFARSLRLRSFATPSPAADPAPTVELVIPISVEDCKRAERKIPARCGEPARVPASLMTLDWKRATSLSLSFEQPRRVTLNSVGSTMGSRLRTWTVDTAARRVRAEFPCLRPVRFRLLLPGTPMGGRCDPGGKRLRLELAAPASMSPSLFVDGTPELALHMSGSRVATRVEGGILSAGDTTRNVGRGRDRLVFVSHATDIGVDLSVGAGTERRHLEVEGKRVDSLTSNGDEWLPSRYENEKEAWLAVMCTVLGLVLGSLGAVLARMVGGKSA
jgi:hypothetical protein